MYTLYVESRLAGSLFGNVILEINPRERVRDIINNYLNALQSEENIYDLAVYNDNNHKLDWNATLESEGVDDGTTLFLGHDRSNALKSVHVGVIGISTIFIACILFIVTTVLFAVTGGTIPFDYGIVIDAGSTHTEVFLYHWSGDKNLGTGNVIQKESCEYEVGIASGTDPVNILSCVNNVSTSVPKGSSPVLYLGATAGMRILNLTNPKEAHLVLTSLKYALSASSVQVKSVGIISGENEALFSWISTNFLYHALDNPHDNHTYGALDLGGASTQYAYAVSDDYFRKSNDITSLKLYGNEFHVKSASYLCFGYIEAMYRHEAIMFMLNSSSTLYDPCLPKGYIENINANFFSKKPCIQNLQFNKWLQNYTFDILTVTGSSRYEECRKNILTLINEKECKKSGFEQCLPNVNLRSLNLKFTAFSGFYYVVNYLNGTNSLSAFINSTIDWCSLTWKEIQNTQPQSELDHILRYCFAATYIIELFIEKYSFDAQTWNSINFTKKIENADIGWTLGYMINSTNAIPEELPNPPVISSTIFVLLVILSCAMILISVFVIKKYGDMKLKPSHSHARLLEV